MKETALAPISKAAEKRLSMGMKKRFFLPAVATATALSAFAIPSAGEISFDGAITFNTLDLATATAISSFANPRVSAAAQFGNYAAVPDDTPVTFAQPINFAVFSGPLENLWQISHEGINCTFDLNTLAVTFQAPGFLNLSGQGLAHITGFDNTPGVWRMTAQEGVQRFSFSASSTASGVSVPDNGSTVLLLGVGFVAVGIIHHTIKGQKIPAGG